MLRGVLAGFCVLLALGSGACHAEPVPLQIGTLIKTGNVCSLEFSVDVVGSGQWLACYSLLPPEGAAAWQKGQFPQSDWQRWSRWRLSGLTPLDEVRVDGYGDEQLFFFVETPDGYLVSDWLRLREGHEDASELLREVLTALPGEVRLQLAGNAALVLDPSGAEAAELRRYLGLP